MALDWVYFIWLLYAVLLFEIVIRFAISNVVLLECQRFVSSFIIIVYWQDNWWISWNYKCKKQIHSLFISHIFCVLKITLIKQTDL